MSDLRKRNQNSVVLNENISAPAAVFPPPLYTAGASFLFRTISQHRLLVCRVGSRVLPLCLPQALDGWQLLSSSSSASSRSLFIRPSDGSKNDSHTCHPFAGCYRAVRSFDQDNHEHNESLMRALKIADDN